MESLALRSLTSWSLCTVKTLLLDVLSFAMLELMILVSYYSEKIEMEWHFAHDKTGLNDYVLARPLVYSAVASSPEIHYALLFVHHFYYYSFYSQNFD